MLKKNHTKMVVTAVVIFVVAGVLLFSGCASNNTSAQSEVNTTGPQASSVAGWGINSISPEEANDLIQANKDNPNFVIIDVRLSKWMANGYIEGAVNIPLNTSNPASFQSKVAGLDKNKTYLTYCPDGCNAAARVMNDLGFNKIYVISGGYNSWVQKGLPVVQ